MRGRVRMVDDSAQLALGLLGEPTAPGIALPVRDALRHSDLLTIYYASGHTFTHGTLYKPQSASRPFPNWEWHDFSGYTIAREKPGTSKWSPAEIHAAIGEEGDRSLFSWVKDSYSTGWLTCDDGSGELADFIHVDANDFTVTFIHVKGAENDSLRRGVSATAYEVVTSQAVKNVYFMNDGVLSDHLRSSPVTRPATWADGIREADRADLIEAIEARDARSGYRVVIVQPHMRKEVYDLQYESLKIDGKPSPDLLRLRRLENILNGGRPSMTGMGADLFVYGSLR